MRLAILALAAALSAAPAWAQLPGAIPGGATVPAAPIVQAPSATGPTTNARPARHQRMKLQERFDAANTTHDGKLTLDQAKASNMTRIVTNFDKMDATHKGYVTTDDIRTFNRAQRAARKPAGKSAG